MRKNLGKILWIASLTWSLAARAQLIPQVPLPVPNVPLPTLPATEAAAGVGNAVRGLRTLRIDHAYREHRAELDRDGGELIVRAEVVGIDMSAPAREHAVKETFLVVRTQDFADLGISVTVLKTPEGWSARRGLKRLRKLDPAGSYDFNHVYFDSGAITHDGARVVAADLPGTGGGALTVRVGLIDSGVDSTHISLRENALHRLGCEGAVVPSAHGTAVASLLAGSAAGFAGAAPRAELFAADVYCGKPTGGAVDAVAGALGWMARERIPVINVSLVGPRNALLERMVSSLVARGHLIVAAVGNDGPAAPPLYPASYAGVVGVTAIDARRKVLLEAGRGSQVDLAAPGADLTAAISGQAEAYGAVRGTSFAAPLVAGLLARQLLAPDRAASERALATLIGSAVDLAPRGRDDIYGAGAVALDLGTGGH